MIQTPLKRKEKIRDLCDLLLTIAVKMYRAAQKSVGLVKGECSRRVEEIENHETGVCKHHQMISNLDPSTVQYGNNLNQNLTPCTK